MLEFPGGRTRALTFSYDDGITQDMRLVQLFNLYGLKGTFNINTGIPTTHHWTYKDAHVHYIEHDVMPQLYKGHEVAVHTLNHPRLYDLSDEQLAYELREDKLNIEKLIGTTAVGMAYPYGDCDERIMKAVADQGLLYGRKVPVTNSFALPTNLLAWEATCHHKAENLMELADQFLAEGDDLRLFYIWGHSYEFDADHNWTQMEEFCTKMGRREDIWYCTNGEFALWMLQNGLMKK